MVHVELLLRVAARASGGDRLTGARHVDALAVVDGRRLVERVEIRFPGHSARREEGVDDARARRKPIHARVGHRAGDVHHDRWLGRAGRCWRLFHDRDGLAVTAMKASNSERDDRDERDRQEDQDRPAHVGRVSGTSRRA